MVKSTDNVMHNAELIGGAKLLPMRHLNRVDSDKDFAAQHLETQTLSVVDFPICGAKYALRRSLASTKGSKHLTK